MPYKVNELFGKYVNAARFPDLHGVLASQSCPYRTDGVCQKMRKSYPDTKIGTCSVCIGQDVTEPYIICPYRITEHNRIFNDCLSLIDTTGNDLYLLPEVSTVAGNIDYVLAAINDGELVDFVGIELQTLDTTGTIWPHRQKMLIEKGYAVEDARPKSVGINWKMTEKTILAQLVQKSQLFSHVNKPLVLLLQRPLYDDMASKFDFTKVRQSKATDTVHFHIYKFTPSRTQMNLSLNGNLSISATDFERIMSMESDSENWLAELTLSIMNKVSDEYLYSPFH